MKFRAFIIACLASVSLLLTTAAAGQPATGDSWNGIWIAEGTLFSLGVAVNDNQMEVSDVESLGFKWNSSHGKVSGYTATVEVEYGGAYGVVKIELIDDKTAIAYPLSCVPDFTVVCVLIRGQQARFIKR